MENTQNKFAALAALAILVILLLVIFLFKPEQPVEAPVVDETPLPSQVDPALNENIVNALSLFADIAPDINDVEAVCVGGFINDRVAPLKKIADDIVSNRIIDPQTTQHATTQDEAGISCESTSTAWVLFTALNNAGKDNNGKYYCVDSIGAKGKYDINRESVQCKIRTY
jgi:hypothetical protein